MATSVSASFSMGDVSQQRLLQRPTHHHQSILPLRRERTTISDDLNRTRDSNPVYSQQLPVRSAAFSGGMTGVSRFGRWIVCSLEKQYDRRQASSQARSAKSDEVDSRFALCTINCSSLFAGLSFNRSKTAHRCSRRTTHVSFEWSQPRRTAIQVPRKDGSFH